MAEYSRNTQWQKGVIIAGAVAAAAYSAFYLHRLYYRNRRKVLLTEVWLPYCILLTSDSSWACASPADVQAAAPRATPLTDMFSVQYREVMLMTPEQLRAIRDEFIRQVSIYPCQSREITSKQCDGLSKGIGNILTSGIALPAQMEMGLESHGQSTLMSLPTMIDVLPTGYVPPFLTQARANTIPKQLRACMGCAWVAMLLASENTFLCAGMNLAFTTPWTWGAQIFAWSQSVWRSARTAWCAYLYSNIMLFL